MKGADLVGPCLAVYEPLLVLWGRSLGPPILSPSENVKVAPGGERKETVIGGLEVSRGAIKGARQGWRYDLISDPVTDFGSIAKYCCWLPGALPAS